MISCLAPTSMPRVGSSRISSFGSVASQRASSTFCWLPPESSPIGCSGAGGRMPSRLDVAVGQLAAGACGRSRRQTRQRAACSASVEVLAHRQVGGRCPRACGPPSRSRCPCAMASRGSRRPTGLPSIATLPPSALSAPNSSARRLGAARAQQAGEAHDLAAVQRQVDRRQHALARDAVGRAEDIAAFAAWLSAPASALASSASAGRADHLVHQREPGQPGAAVLAFALAVAHDSDAVRDRIDLVEEVGHEQDRHALLAQAAQDAEQGLRLRPRRGWRSARREPARAHTC